jgi:hypothetical protein
MDLVLIMKLVDFIHNFKKWNFEGSQALRSKSQRKNLFLDVTTHIRDVKNCNSLQSFFRYLNYFFPNLFFIKFSKNIHNRVN